MVIIDASENVLNEAVCKLVPYEDDLFFFINGHHTPFLDTFMYLYSNKFTWFISWAVLLFMFIWRKPKLEALFVVLATALLVTLCDQISASVLKPLFCRFRPTHFEGIKDFVHIVNDYRGGRHGFISAHAANSFGVATLTSLLFRYRIYTLSIFFYALVTCYSRVYLGVHFVSDVVGGMLVGSLIGWGVYCLYTFARIRLLHIPCSEARKPIFERWRANVFLSAIGITVLVFFVISAFS